MLLPGRSRLPLSFDFRLSAWWGQGFGFRSRHPAPPAWRPRSRPAKTGTVTAVTCQAAGRVLGNSTALALSFSFPDRASASEARDPRRMPRPPKAPKGPQTPRSRCLLLKLVRLRLRGQLAALSLVLKVLHSSAISTPEPTEPRDPADPADCRAAYAVLSRHYGMIGEFGGFRKFFRTVRSRQNHEILRAQGSSLKDSTRILLGFLCKFRLRFRPLCAPFGQLAHPRRPATTCCAGATSRIPLLRLRHRDLVLVAQADLGSFAAATCSQNTDQATDFQLPFGAGRCLAPGA